MEKLLLTSLSLTRLFVLNIDEIYGPLKKQKLQHIGRTYTCPESNPDQNMADVHRSRLYIRKNRLSGLFTDALRVVSNLMV